MLAAGRMRVCRKWMRWWSVAVIFFSVVCDDVVTIIDVTAGRCCLCCAYPPLINKKPYLPYSFANVTLETRRGAKNLSSFFLFRIVLTILGAHSFLPAFGNQQAQDGLTPPRHEPRLDAPHCVRHLGILHQRRPRLWSWQHPLHLPDRRHKLAPWRHRGM